MKKLMLVLIECLAMATAWGKSFSIDLRKPVVENGLRAMAKHKVASAVADDSGCLRKVNLDAGAADVGAVVVGDALTFTLFDDVVITLTLKRQMPSPLGGDVFLAEASGYKGVNNAVVICDGDGLTIDVQDYLNNRVYKVISRATGVSVHEIKPSHEGKCCCDALTPPNPSAMTSRSDSQGNISVDKLSSPNLASSPMLLGSVSQQGDSCIDILVAYDKNATVWVNANGGGMTNFAQIAVQKMNAALANTGLDESFRFRLVGVASVSVSTNDVHKALYAISDNNEGWATIKTVRDIVGADIVTTLIDTGAASGTAGVGWSLSSESSLSSFASSAYNVCAVRSVAQSHTMTHECGHNLGAGHPREQETQPGPQLYDYSAGYFFTGADGKKYCTIMAYTDEGMGGTRIPYFSSPNYTYAGIAVGDATHDNTRTISNTWSYAANWRSQKVPMSYDVIFEPASGAPIDGSLTVTLTPGKIGAEIRYTLDGSTPTVSSPLYTGAITLRGTTTIRAVTVIDGAVSLPFTAIYYANDDLGYALGLPELEWKLWVPETSLCGVQSTQTVDGVALGATIVNDDICTLSTTISGPATITWKQWTIGNRSFSVLCDGEKVFCDTWGYWSANLVWEEHSADIPDGEHTVEFNMSSIYGTTYYFDDFNIYYIPKPMFSPAASSDPFSPAEFTDELMVSLVAPSDDAMIYYTIDGTDPRGENAILYDGPFFINESLRVKAIASIPGKGASAIATGCYCKRVKPAAGEWTLWGEAAYEAVQKDGRMIADLCWNYPSCGWSAALEPIMTDPAFTTWAAANGVYLLADTWGDKVGATGSRFFNGLYWQAKLYTELEYDLYYPTFVFASPPDLTTCLGAMLARNDGHHTTNGCYYRDSPESLIECFASFLGAAPLGAPVASVADANGMAFPFSVTLSNTNGIGTIYYTLDGTAPTREKGTRYTDAITIPVSGTTLKAVVWPDDANGVSGIPLVISYESSSVPPVLPVPFVVTGLTASAGEYGYGILLRWSPTADATSYAIYRCESDNPSAAEQIGVTKQLRYWDRTGMADKTYWYWVKAVNGHGESDFSVSVSGWRPFAYRIVFDANKGLSAMKVQYFMRDKEQKLLPNEFVHVGWRFKGWATTPNGPVVYANGALVTPVADMTLYAVWVKDMIWRVEDNGVLKGVDSNGLTDAVIPDYVTRIDDLAFDEVSIHRGITSVTIPDSVTSIGNAVFRDCESLMSIYFLGNAPSVEDTDLTVGVHNGGAVNCTVYVHRESTGWGVDIPGIWKGMKIVYVEDELDPVTPEPVTPDPVTPEPVTPDPVTPVPVTPEPATPEPVTPGYEVIEATDIIAPYEVPKAVVLQGAVYDGGKVVGIVDVKLGKVNAKKKTSKVSGTLTTLDGKKHKIAAFNLAEIDGTSSKAVTLEVKDFGTMSITIGGTQFAGSMGKYHVQSADVGGNWSKGGTKVYVDGALGDRALPAGTIEKLLPDGVPVIAAGGKWKFAKAANVKWAKPKKGAALPERYDAESGKGLVIDTSKGDNLSAMKLSYTPKKGTFKGSFKVYALEGAGKATKLKKYTVKVSGVVVGGAGYGTATCKKPAVSWAVTVK